MCWPGKIIIVYCTIFTQVIREIVKDGLVMLDDWLTWNFVLLENDFCYLGLMFVYFRRTQTFVISSIVCWIGFWLLSISLSYLTFCTSGICVLMCTHPAMSYVPVVPLSMFTYICDSLECCNEKHIYPAN